ncbi:ImpA domain protein [compost metagenome]
MAPLPKALSAPQLQTLRQDKADWLASIEYPQAAQQQLTQLTHLSPDWAIDYGNQLVGHVQTLWPQSSMAQQMVAHWQQQQQDSAMPLESLAGWHQGMTQLQQLTSRLNGLDGQRGKYMTVSELKSAVFAITQSFNKTVPLEEQLRQLSERPSSAGFSQTKMQLERLLSRYALLKKHNPSHEE